MKRFYLAIIFSTIFIVSSYGQLRQDQVKGLPDSLAIKINAAQASSIVGDSLDVRIPKLNSIAELRALPPSDGYGVAELNGYYSAGDGGAGQFYWNPTSTATDDSAMVIKVTAITTGRWLRVQMGTTYHLEWFGIKADGVQDETWNIQKAIDYAMSSGAGKVVCNTVGTLKITNTIKLGYGAVYASIEFIGVSGLVESPGGSVIDASSIVDRPAINVQGARKTIIKGWTIKGANTVARTVADNQTFYSDTASWTTGTLSNGRYNPYCGISIDAYSGTGGAGYYTNDPYGRNNSSLVEIANCFIYQFVVGVMVQPNNVGHNAEAINVHDCNISYNVYNVSVGGSQSRATVFSENLIAGAHTVLTTNTHGAQQGNIPEIRGGTMGSAYRLFKVNTAFSPMKVSKMHSESFLELGSIGNSSVLQNTATFESCTFSIDEATGTYRGMVHLVTNASTTFNGCSFNLPYGILNVVGGGRIHYNGCSFNAYITWTDLWYFDVSFARVVPLRKFTQCEFRTGGLAGSTIHPMNDETYYNTLDTGRQNILSTTKWLWVGDSLYKVTTGDVEFYGLTSGYVWSDSGLTFTSADSSFCIGDILRWRSIAKDGSQYIVPSLRVTSLTNNKTTVTAERLFNEDEYDEAYAPTLITVTLRHYLHGALPTGDITSGTDTIKNVNNASTKFYVGDQVTGTGIPVDSRIREISGTSLIMTKNNTSTANGVSLYFGRRKALVAVDDANALINTALDNYVIDGQRYTNDSTVFHSTVVMSEANSTHPDSAMIQYNNPAGYGIIKSKYLYLATEFVRISDNSFIGTFLLDRVTGDFTMGNVGTVPTGGDIYTDDIKADSINARVITVTNQISGTDTFTTSATADTITNASISATDVFIVSINDATPVADDLLSWTAEAGRVIIRRVAGTTLGLKYSYFRVY